MISNHTKVYVDVFGYRLASEEAGTKCQRCSRATKVNLLNKILSYIPIVNAIAMAIIISQEQKKSKGEFLKTQEGKAMLARVILCSIGLIPAVMLLDVIGTMIKCGLRSNGVAQKRLIAPGSHEWYVKEGYKLNASGKYENII